MTIRKIEVGVARKTSRDYSSTEHSIRLEADLEPGEDEAGATAQLRQIAIERVREGFRSPGKGEF